MTPTPTRASKPPRHLRNWPTRVRQPGTRTGSIPAPRHRTRRQNRTCDQQQHQYSSQHWPLLSAHVHRHPTGPTSRPNPPRPLLPCGTPAQRSRQTSYDRWASIQTPRPPPPPSKPTGSTAPGRTRKRSGSTTSAFSPRATRSRPSGRPNPQLPRPRWAGAPDFRTARPTDSARSSFLPAPARYTSEPPTAQRHTTHPIRAPPRTGGRQHPGNRPPLRSSTTSSVGRGDCNSATTDVVKGLNCRSPILQSQKPFDAFGWCGLAHAVLTRIRATRPDSPVQPACA